MTYERINMYIYRCVCILRGTYFASKPHRLTTNHASAGIVKFRLTKRRRNALKRLRTFLDIFGKSAHTCLTHRFLWITAELTRVTLGCQFSILCNIRCVFDLVCGFDASCFQARERERADREAMERPGDMFLILTNVKTQSLRHTLTMKPCLHMFA